MSDKSFDRQDQAFRLVQALSGVDGELLARTERQPSAKKKIVQFMGRYGALCAACLMCVVLGSIYLLYGGSRSKDSAANEAAPVKLAQDARYGITLEGACEEEVSPSEAQEVLLSNAVSAVDWKIPAEKAQFGVASNGIDTVTKENATGGVPEAETEDGEYDTTSGANMPMSAIAAFSLEAPAGYTGNPEQELQEDGSGVYTWYQEGIPCYVRVVLLDSATIDRLCESGEVLVRDSEGQWLTKLPAADEAGLRQFAMSVGNGVVTEYYGYLTESEIRALFE